MLVENDFPENFANSENSSFSYLLSVKCVLPHISRNTRWIDLVLRYRVDDDVFSNFA